MTDIPKLWRQIRWDRVGAALSLCIIAISVAMLFRLLKGLDLDKVIESVRATPMRQIVAAACLIVGGYFMLTFYDLFALRALGRRDIPYRLAALAALTSYSIGHNVGVAAIIAGPVRYHVYSTHGVDAIDVARVCFLAALTFWLGNAAVLGLGIALEPGALTAIDQLPPSINRALALVILAVLACYLVWVWQTPRVIGRGGWQLQLPNGPSTLLQMTIGVVDIVCCALAMYLLLPSDPAIGVLPLVVIFASAILLGFASHAPGGLGVFDAAMLLALAQFDREQLLAALLLFRLLYYILPFTLSVLMLGLREIVNSCAGPHREESKRLEAAAPLKGGVDPVP